MAKFSGKNIEFKDGQKAIFGTDDDSAIYWDNAAGHLVFTTVVSGIDPTAEGHLVTKRYIDEEIATLSGGIVQDHGNLYGLGDDDHPHYMLSDGTRAFTAPVAGVDPVAGADLVTKDYLEDVLLGATESGTQVGNILFGSQFVYDVSEGTSSTNSTSYQQKLSINTGDVPEGSYRVAWSFDWRISKNNATFYVRVHQDNSTTLEEWINAPYNDVTIWNPVNDFYYIETLASGTHTFDLDYHSSSTGATAYIRSARLEFWRVS